MGKWPPVGPDAAQPVIRLATINIENIYSTTEYLKHLLTQADIVLIQEHWMFSYEKNQIEDILPGYKSSIKCFDDHEPINHMYRPPRGYAGVATIWSPRLNDAMEELPDGGTRVLVNQLSTPQGLITIVNSYMPTDGCKEKDTDYQAVLDEIQEISTKYQTHSTIIWAGDVNASFRRKKPNKNDTSLQRFCKDMGFTSKIADEEVSTFHHFNGTSKSQIDHILTMGTQTPVIASVKVCNRHPTNTSSHDAVIASTSLQFPKPTDKKSKPRPLLVRRKPKWSKMDLTVYRRKTEEYLSSLIRTGGLDQPTEVIVERLNYILTAAAADAGDVPPKTCKRTTKMPWSRELKPLIKNLKRRSWQLRQLEFPNPILVAEVNTLKREFRSAQRQLAAIQRKSLHKRIMDAHENDTQLFYKLIKRQRGTGSNTLATIDFGEKSQLSGWAQYYEDLATPVDDPLFDASYKMKREMMYLLTQSQEAATNETHEVSQTQISKYISQLKNNKAADLYGITAEHLKHASSSIIPTLAAITNKAFQEQKLPSKFKTGKVVPVLKKGKPAKDPNSHRRITVSSIIGKVTEKEMLRASKPTLSLHQSKLQFGFTELCSASNCSFVISEAIAEAKDNAKCLYITMLDARKAFDVVWHDSTLVSLHQQGIKGPLWNLYANMYAEVSSRICIEGELSREIKEKQGIRQGAETSTEIFKGRGNKTLNTIASLPDSLRIGSVQVGAPTCADDTCLLSTSLLGAQTALLVAQDDANRERFQYSESKTKAILVNDKSKLTPDILTQAQPLMLNGQALNYVSQEKHLGIERTSTATASATIKARIQTGRKIAFMIMGAGFYGLNGISPEVSIHIINIYILPAIMFGLDTLRLTRTDYGELANYHRKLLRCIQHLPKATAGPALYLLTGSLPVEALHHKNVLTLFGSMTRREGSTEHSIIARQLAMKDMSSKSWLTLVRELLQQYSLPSAFLLLEHPLKKERWKNMLKSAINQFWEKELRRKAAEKSTLKLLNAEACAIGKIHPIWSCHSDPIEVGKACTKARMLVQRYGLYGNHSAGLKKSPKCPLCEGPEETMVHFILTCPALTTTRQPHLTKLCSILDDFFFLPADDDDLVKVILDSSTISWAPEQDRHAIEFISRDLCYKLHEERSILIDSNRIAKRPVPVSVHKQAPKRTLSKSGSPYLEAAST